MPDDGIKRVLQATPVGYLVEMADGSQATFPEKFMVDAGYVGPTEGLYSQPEPAHPMADPYAGMGNVVEQAPPVQTQPPAAPPAEAAPAAAPAPAVAPAPEPPTSIGVRASDSGQTLVRRTDVKGAPAPLDLSQPRADLQAQRSEVAGGFTDARTAVDAQGKAIQGQGDVNAKYATKGADLNRDFAELQKRGDEAVNAHIEKKTAELNEKVARVPQEDPGKLWGDRNAFQNACGLLSSMIGGMLAVSTGSGRNLGLESLERDIDRSIQAQRTNIENEWKRIAHDKDTIQQYKEWKVQSRAWAGEQRVLMLETLALDREAEAQKFVSASKQAELMGQAAELRIRSAEAQQTYIKDIAQMAKLEKDSAIDAWWKTEQLTLDKLNSASTRSLQSAQKAKLAAEMTPEGQKPIPVFKLPNGQSFYLDPKFTQGRTPAQVGELANKLGEETAKDAHAIDAMQKHRQLIAQLGSKYSGPGARTKWGDEDVRTAQDSLNYVSAQIAHSLSGAQYAEAFREAVKGWVGGPQGWVGGDAVKSQTEYLDSLMTKMERNLGGRGVVVGEKVVAGEGGVPTIAGPTEGGGAVLPKGTVLGERMAPLDTRKSFYQGDIVQTDEKDVAKATKDLGRVVLTGKDPSGTLQALRQLTVTLEAPLAATPAIVDSVFGAVELTDVGGRTAARFPGEGKDQKGTKVRTRDDGIRLMRVGAMRAAAEAEAKGDPAMAGEIMEAAGVLEKRLRGEPAVKPPEVTMDEAYDTVGGTAGMPTFR